MEINHIGEKLKSTTLWMYFFGYCASVVALIILFLWGLNLYTHHGEEVEVPNLKDLTYDQAMETLDDLDLKALVVDSDFVKSLPPGAVLEQTPKAGALVKSGRTIYLTLNASSSPTRAMPDLADNSSVRQAQVKLTAMGFKLGPVEPIDGEKDWVYAIKYNGKKVFAGDRVPSDATLVLVVGTGMYGAEGDSVQYDIDDLGDYSEEVTEDLNPE